MSGIEFGELMGLGRILQLLRRPRRTGMLDRGTCWIVTAIVDGDRDLLVSVYAPTRQAAVRSVQRGRVSEWVDGGLITHERPSVLGEPIEQVEWLARARSAVPAPDEALRAPVLIDA